MKLWTAMALRITFSTYIVYSSQTATLAKIVRSKSHPKWLFSVFLSNKSWKEKKHAMFLQKTQALRMESLYCLPNRCAGLGTREDQGFTSKPWSQLVAFQVGGVFPWDLPVLRAILRSVWGGVPAVCFNSCWWRWCLGWTSDLCRLCCGSSSSAVLTGVVICGSKTSRLFFHEAERMYCIVLTTRKGWGFG